MDMSIDKNQWQEKRELLMKEHMLIKSCPDIIIRTGDEIRLSNFLTF